MVNPIPIQIACAADINYLPHCAAMLRSVLICNSGVFVHFLCPEELSNKKLKALKEFVEEYGGEFKEYRISREKLKDLSSSGRISKVMWYRIFLPELLKDFDKVLYLDCDTIVRRSLTDIWMTPLNGALVAAVENVFEKKNKYWPVQLGLKRYFNSGVLLINLKGWREEGVIEEIKKTAKKMKAEIIWPDQDVLNIVLSSRRIKLSPIWNCQNSLYDLKEARFVFKKDEIEEATRNPGIIHFEGGGVVKPWHYLNRSPWREEYLYNRQKTPWPLMELEGKTVFNVSISWMPKKIMWLILITKDRVKSCIGING